MNKSKSVIIAQIIMITLLIGGYIFMTTNQSKNLFDKKSSNLFNIQTQSLEEILDTAKTIKLEDKLFSFGKHFYILVDNVVVGEVKGRAFPIFGQELKMYDTRGNLIKSESQIKRVGPTEGKAFNLSLDRLAKIYDKNGSISGYIGEQSIKDFFSLKHKQYFYDTNKKLLGHGEMPSLSLSKDGAIFDNNKNIDYTIDGKLLGFPSRYTIIKNDNSDIGEEDAIFYTIIEDSIKSSSSKSSKK